MAILVMTRPLPAAPFADALRRAAPDVPVWTESDDPPAPADAVEAILAWRLDAGVLPRYPNLRVLCSSGAGVDKLLVPDLPAHVPVTRVIDPAQAAEMTQYVVAQVLSFTRELPHYAAQQAARDWTRHPVRPPARCRVGVMGLGAVGRTIAGAFGPFGYPVAGWSRTRHALPGIATFAGREELPAFLARSDILVCALPLTDATRGLLNRDTLSQLPQGAFVVNVGRGEQLVEPDLRALLDSGHLAGAALDVMEREPPRADAWFWDHPKVTMTPHIAAQASFDVVAQQCVEALRISREGKAQVRAIDRRTGY